MGTTQKALLVLFATSVAFAQNEPVLNYWQQIQRQREQAVNNRTAGSVNSSVQSGQQALTIQNSNYASLRDSSANNLNNTQKGQAATQIVMVGLAGAAAVQAGMCTSTNWAACAAAAVLYLKANQARQSANSYNGPILDSGANYCEYNTTSCTNGQPPPNPYSSLAPTAPAIDSTMDQITTSLSHNGYDVDPATGKVKGPPNKEFNGNDPKSVAAAIGAEGAAALAAKIAAAEKDALAKVDQVKATAVAATGYEGGGGASMGSAGAGYEDGLTAQQKDALAKAAKQRKPAQVSGLSKNYNGDPIGVAGDSIFAMMARRYQLKNNQKTFFGPDLR